MAQSVELTAFSYGYGSRRSSPARRNPATLDGGTSGFACSRDRYEVDGPGRWCCRTRPGSFCLAVVGCLLPLQLDQRLNFVRDLPGGVEVPPCVDAGERAVGELFQQPPHPLRLGPAQRQVILRFDQEEPGNLG